MKTLLDVVLKDKQVERYNVFASLEEIHRLLRNQRFTLDRLDARLAHVEGHIHYDLDIDATPRSSVKDPAPISSFGPE